MKPNNELVLGSEDSKRSLEWSRNETVLVGTTSKEISEAKDRKMILVRNNSTDTTAVITINMGYGEAVAGAGIVLKAGESFSDNAEAGYENYKGVYTAICSNANGILSITER